MSSNRSEKLKQARCAVDNFSKTFFSPDPPKDSILQSTFSQFYQLDVQSFNFLKDKKDEQEQIFSWFIQASPDLSKQAKLLAHGVKQVPFAAIALPIHPACTENEINIEGRAYCFLPLPILTNLPVHINSFFALSSNRRELEKSLGTFNESDGNPGLWNQMLLESTIPIAYQKLLQTVAVEFLDQPSFCIENTQVSVVVHTFTQQGNSIKYFK